MPAPTADLEAPPTPAATIPGRSPDTTSDKPDTTSDKAVSRGPAHIAEQRVDADPLPPAGEAGKTEPAPTSGKKDKAKNGEDPAAKAPKAAKAPAAKAGKSTPEKAHSKKQAEANEEGKPSVPGARLSAYAEEAAELLAGLSAHRRRRPNSDEPAAGEVRDTD